MLGDVVLTQVEPVAHDQYGSLSVRQTSQGIGHLLRVERRLHIENTQLA